MSDSDLLLDSTAAGESHQVVPIVPQVNPILLREQRLAARRQRDHDRKAGIITPKKVRHLKQARLVLQGKTYTEIAQETNPGVAYPRQTVSNSVHSQAGQAAIREIAETSDDYDVAKLRRVVNRFVTHLSTSDIDKIKPQQVKVLDLAMQSERMLVQVQEQKQTILEKRMDFSSMTEGEIVSGLQARLKLSHAGIIPQPSDVDQGRTVELVPQDSDSKA